jgi:TRAP-type C4-dicarboxylate transport system permease small subunit
MTTDDAGASAGTSEIGVLDKLARALAMIGGATLLFAALLVCASILRRGMAGQSIPGDYEIVQMSTGIAAFTFLPYCALRRTNIYVDAFTTRLSPRRRNRLDALWDLVFALFAALIAWRLAVGGYETTLNKTTTMSLGLPVGWAVLADAVLAAFLVLALVTAARRALRRGA